MSLQNPKLISDAVNDKYYPSLEGLRGIAIILVVLYHLGFKPFIIFNGGLGVDIFFVLSGFLITSLCLKEKRDTGGLSLKNFYIRRALRIFPVAYLYLLVLFILNTVFHLNIAWFQFLGAAFYLMDISYFRAHNFCWFTGHYWSLAVEEQFYLIFPFLIKKRTGAYVAFVLFVVIALPVFCYFQYLFPFFNQGVFYWFTHFLIKFQGIAVGCLFAILAFNKYLDIYILQTTKTIGNLIAFVLVFALGYNDFFTINSVFTNCVISILLGYIVVTNIAPANDFIFHILNLKPLKIIGKLSYSIYIWQQLFTAGGSQSPYWILRYPYNLIWIIVVSFCSYYLYERYFLKFKSRFSIHSNSTH